MNEPASTAENPKIGRITGINGGQLNRVMNVNKKLRVVKPRMTHRKALASCSVISRPITLSALALIDIMMLPRLIHESDYISRTDGANYRTYT